MNNDEQQTARQGILFAIAGYTMWGIAPIYFKAIQQVSAPEILCHRVIWSFLILVFLVHFSRKWHSVKNVLTSKKLVYIVATSILLGCNWLIFIWAVNSDHMLDASLGYYINPLLNVLLGMIFLGERLRKLQWLAVILATVGVLIQIIAFGRVPIVAISLAATFGLYALLRKKVSLEAQTGLFLEMLILLPLAMIYMFGFAHSATSDMLDNTTHLNVLLVSAGIVTTLPFLSFNAAATRLKLSTLGFFQYIGPSLMFLLAVLLYGETVTLAKAVTFVFIWAALVIFSFDGVRFSKKKKALVRS
ncbi:EamA family transporter RarD [Vibrio sp. S4M6]|uniref:EamA family transporter RarD n=1 Tax=Vibrio sinus TaxID=2946865 RepID=UPI00202AB2FE|nr:EamA family transporter RarD [Vibrio sinus]MCL9782924.1 EamA family transporter RarD [Vibrio sinus]